MRMRSVFVSNMRSSVKCLHFIQTSFIYSVRISSSTHNIRRDSDGAGGAADGGGG